MSMAESVSYTRFEFSITDWSHVNGLRKAGKDWFEQHFELFLLVAG